ncbi:discoidin domain-containing protein [Paenibacillus koleovorans]|uniref:discoidin domain-containing protein n=1 Tax=Paenibacillus koleovorans TaxID=121608 RepID=UPI001C3FD712|nr:discoidin domain-containing protein [Paenibacillus koleovorans]
MNDNTTGTGNNQFEFTGTWDYWTGAGKYENDDHASSTTNNQYQVRFYGTQIKIYAAKAAHHGIMAVSIDGGAETNVDAYAATRVEQALLYTSPVLTNGQHTLRVRVTGTKNSSSTGNSISADRVDITTVPDSSSIPISAVAFGSEMTGGLAVYSYDGDTGTRWTNDETLANAWIRYDLGSVKIIKDVWMMMYNGGTRTYPIRIEVSSDGSTYTQVWSGSTALNSGLQTINVTDLDGRYVRVSMTAANSQGSNWFSIHETEVWGSSFSTATVNDNTTGTGNNQFEYSGTWDYWTGSGKYNNDDHASSTTNNYYQVRFYGTQIKIYAAKASHHGIMAVSIDGGAETNVDAYAATRVEQALLYSSPILANGQHTLRVRVTGTKNSSSTGYSISADRVDVITTGM